jgi:hypothetical protein
VGAHRRTPRLPDRPPRQVDPRPIADWARLLQVLGLSVLTKADVSLCSEQVKITFRDRWRLAVHRVKCLLLVIIALYFCLPTTHAPRKNAVHWLRRDWDARNDAPKFQARLSVATSGWRTKYANALEEDRLVH